MHMNSVLLLIRYSVPFYKNIKNILTVQSTQNILNLMLPIENITGAKWWQATFPNCTIGISKLFGYVFRLNENNYYFYHPKYKRKYS